MPASPDPFEIFTILLVVDGLITIVNLCVLGIIVKLYSEIYKAHLLQRRSTT